MPVSSEHHLGATMVGQPMTRALACFNEDSGGHWAERWLKPGFKHVFVCLVVRDRYWVRIDAVNGAPDIDVVANSAFDLASFYRKHGYAVLEVDAQSVSPRVPMIAANCVGLAKMALGVRAPLVWTPWQLFKLLRPVAILKGKDNEDQPSRLQPKQAA